MASLHVQLIAKAAEWFLVTPQEMLVQPAIKHQGDFANANKAFTLVCYYMNHTDLMDLKMTPQQICKYFDLCETHVLKAIDRHQYFISSGPWYRMAVKKVKEVIDTHNQLLYENSKC